MPILEAPTNDPAVAFDSLMKLISDTGLGIAESWNFETLLTIPPTIKKL